jgi:hypothetical protein
LSSILPIFLFGYFIVLIFKGVGHDTDTWNRAQEIGDFLLLFGGNIVVAFVFGGIGIVALLAIVAEGPRTLCQIQGHRLILLSESPSKQNKVVADRPPPPTEFESIQLARRLAIEECAEEAYRYLIRCDRLSLADYDDVESDAVGVKEFLLSLGETEDTNAS